MTQGWRWIFAACSTVVFLGCLDETSKTNAESAAVGITNSSVPAPVSEVVADTPPLRAVIPPADLSPGVSELVKLAQSGVGEEVLQAYVEKTGRTFNPSVDEIVYLKDLGIPEAVLAALVRKGNLSDDVAQAITTPEESETAPLVEVPNTTNYSAPTLIDPDAPSYSVTAEPAPIVNPPQEVNINYFENTLAPYGTWVDVPDYGRCWQPTVVRINRDWRPYSDRGRWVYTSAGWYWQSDYSWGWAPFHYGRWHQDHRVGWVWVPGSTWGPAWVSWRYTDDYCGWAPLPPTAHYVSGGGFRYRGSYVGIGFDFGLRDDCYTFIPSRRFCDPRPYRYYAPRSHSKTIYNNSVVINNYIRGNNNTIINEGIGRDRIAKATRTPIQTVALRDLPTTSTPVGRAERIERGGSTLAVFRPNVATQNSLVRPQNRPSVPATSTATSAVERRSFTGTRSIPTRSEATVQTPAVAGTTPSAAARSALTRPTPQTSVEERQLLTRNAARSAVAQTAPNPTVNPQPAPAPARVQPSFGSRQIPTRNTPEQNRVAVTPRENPASAVRSIPSATPNSIQRIAPSTPSRPEPSVSPSRVQVSPFQRQQSSSAYGGATLQRSIPTRPAPSVTAPAPVQRSAYSAPAQIDRSSSPRVERSIPQRSQSAPSVQRSAPAQRSQPAAQGNRGGLSRSSRDRN